jgi:Uma2 family endonuclease
MKTLYQWSVAEYHHMIETGLLEGKPVELLEGEVIEMSPEGIPHSFTNRSVGSYLRQLLQDKALISEAHPITLDNSEPEPDIAVVRLPDTIYATHHPYPEDIYWLIEISNKTLDKDLKEKTVTYARNGIPEYWVIDLPHKKLWVFTQPQSDQYQNCSEFTTGTIGPVAFRDLEVEINQLLII